MTLAVLRPAKFSYTNWLGIFTPLPRVIPTSCTLLLYGVILGIGVIRYEGAGAIICLASSESNSKYDVVSSEKVHTINTWVHISHCRASIIMFC